MAATSSGLASGTPGTYQDAPYPEGWNAKDYLRRIPELFAAARFAINQRGDEVIAILIAVAIFYLIVTVPLGLIASVVEKRVAVLR